MLHEEYKQKMLKQNTKNLQNWRENIHNKLAGLSGNRRFS